MLEFCFLVLLMRFSESFAECDVVKVRDVGTHPRQTGLQIGSVVQQAHALAGSPTALPANVYEMETLSVFFWHSTCHCASFGKGTLLYDYLSTHSKVVMRLITL